jgi:hypothetical protein
MSMVIVGVSFAATQSEITFSGEQDGYFEAGQYLATGTITVKRGKTLTFAPGSVVRFKQFAGIIVEGKLKCIGWASQPVIFTSDNNRLKDDDSKYKIPAPFDWNGIQVMDSVASLELENVRITYSTYGLDIKSSSSPISLKGVVFSENGRGGITIDDKQLGVIDNEEFSFVQPDVENAVSAKKSGLSAPSKTKPTTPRKPMSWRMPIRLSLGAITIAGVALGVYEKLQADHSDRLYHEQSGITADNDLKNANKQKNLSVAGWAIGIAGASGFALTFFF